MASYPTGPPLGGPMAASLYARGADDKTTWYSGIQHWFKQREHEFVTCFVHEGFKCHTAKKTMIYSIGSFVGLLVLLALAKWARGPSKLGHGKYRAFWDPCFVIGGLMPYHLSSRWFCYCWNCFYCGWCCSLSAYEQPIVSEAYDSRMFEKIGSSWSPRYAEYLAKARQEVKGENEKRSIHPSGPPLVDDPWRSQYTVRRYHEVTFYRFWGRHEQRDRTNWDAISAQIPTVNLHRQKEYQQAYKRFDRWHSKEPHKRRPVEEFGEIDLYTLRWDIREPTHFLGNYFYGPESRYPGTGYNGPPGHGYNGPPGHGYNGPPGPGYYGPSGPGYYGPSGPGHQRPPGPWYNGPPGSGYNGPPGAGPYGPPGSGYNGPPGAGPYGPPGSGYHEPVYNRRNYMRNVITRAQTVNRIDAEPNLGENTLGGHALGLATYVGQGVTNAYNGIYNWFRPGAANNNANNVENQQTYHQEGQPQMVQQGNGAIMPYQYRDPNQHESQRTGSNSSMGTSSGQGSTSDYFNNAGVGRQGPQTQQWPPQAPQGQPTALYPSHPLSQPIQTPPATYPRPTGPSPPWPGSSPPRPGPSPPRPGPRPGPYPQRPGPTPLQTRNGPPRPSRSNSQPQRPMPSHNPVANPQRSNSRSREASPPRAPPAWNQSVGSVPGGSGQSGAGPGPGPGPGPVSNGTGLSNGAVSNSSGERPRGDRNPYEGWGASEDRDPYANLGQWAAQRENR